MNQSKLNVVKQEMARININILGIQNGWERANLIQMTIISTTVARIPQKKGRSPQSQQESKMQHLGATSKVTE